MNSFLKMYVILGVSFLTVTSCATNNGDGHRLNQSYESDNQSIPESIIFDGGLVMRKEESEKLQIVLFIAPEVGLVVGSELLDTLRSRGWVQLTTQDMSSDTAVDVICRLGANDERVAAECRTASLQAQTPPSAGSISIGRDTRSRFNAEQIREAVAELIERQYVDTVNIAVDVLSKKQKH